MEILISVKSIYICQNGYLSFVHVLPLESLNVVSSGREIYIFNFSFRLPRDVLQLLFFHIKVACHKFVILLCYTKIGGRALVEMYCYPVMYVGFT